VKQATGFLPAQAVLGEPGPECRDPNNPDNEDGALSGAVRVSGAIPSPAQLLAIGTATKRRSPLRSTSSSTDLRPACFAFSIMPAT
jgi:hypothetical protein